MERIRPAKERRPLNLKMKEGRRRRGKKRIRKRKKWDFPPPLLFGISAPDIIWLQAKQKRVAHKRTVLDLEESLKVAMNAYIPRFSGPFGKDMDGRLYWALSPGVVEWENAI